MGIWNFEWVMKGVAPGVDKIDGELKEGRKTEEDAAEEDEDEGDDNGQPEELDAAPRDGKE